MKPILELTHNDQFSLQEAMLPVYGVNKMGDGSSD
jgi:hypothetical protein